ncbi:DUF58 domain-containing protein [bacterium]|nr:DUF58 domain-containing protein [bacterium]
MKKWTWPYRHKQIFMIPNRYGFIAIALFIIFSLIAATYSNNLLFLLAFVHVSFLLICILQTARNLRHVELNAIQILAGFPGETVPVKLILSQKSKKNKLGLILSCEGSEKSIANLPAGDQAFIDLTLTLPQQRGPHQLRRIRLSTESPYGLFYGWLYFKTNTTYHVYPKPIGQHLPESLHVHQHGDFSGLKDYEIGDSLQRISWRHSARNDQWLIKEFKDATTPQLLLRLADCPQKDDEDRLRQMAYWIVACEKSNIDYKIELSKNDKNEKFSRGTNHFHDSLLQLAKWSPQI